MRTPNPINGPWHIDMKGDEFDLAGTDIVISDSHGNVAALTNNDNRDHAKLIAAAPDLLAALQDLWGYVEDLQKSNPGYLGKLCLQDYARLNRALGSAPAAIAKAEGRS